jgi:hypothetical protein
MFVGLIAVFLWIALDGTAGVVAGGGVLVTIAVEQFQLRLNRICFIAT